jgi:hypothetical protein
MTLQKLKRSPDWPDLSYHEKRYLLHHGVLPKRCQLGWMAWKLINLSHRLDRLEYKYETVFKFMME